MKNRNAGSRFIRMSLDKIGTIKQLLAQQRVQMIEESTVVHYRRCPCSLQSTIEK